MFVQYPALHAQEQLHTFRDAVEQAVAHNKGLLNADLENEKIALERDAVKGKLLPSVSANVLYGYTHSNVSIDLPTQQLPLLGTQLFEGTQRAELSSQLAIGGLSATQVLFSGMQITNGQKALAQKFKAQQLLNEAGYEQLAQEVVNSFDQLMLLKEVDLLIDDSERRLDKEHLKVLKAIENGLAIPYDRDKIKLAMLELESRRAEVESTRELLYFKLQELTGISVDELASVSYELTELLLTQGSSQQMNRKELQALETAQKAYEYVLKKENGAKLPTLFAFGNISYANAFGTDVTVKDLPYLGDMQMRSNHLQLAPNYMVGVGLKWNIFEGKTHKSAIEKAKLDIRINANKLADTEEKLLLLNRKAQSDYTLSLKKVAVNQQQRAIAKNNLHLAGRQFEEGLQDVTERLAAENEYYKQSLAYYNQVLSQRAATVELLKSNGNLYQTITNN
jgi:outer membrane protein TolC